MSKPWMPLYVGDYLKKTTHLGALESGAYLHLIMDYWSNGKLPTDERQLARIAKVSDREWSRIRDTLQAFFVDGWRHERIEKELAHAEEVSNKRKEARAKRGNKPPTIEPTIVGTKDDTVTVTVTKKDSEANASGGEPPNDPRTRLFNAGLKTLANITGKTPDSCRSQVGRWLKAANDEAIHVLAAIEDAERNRVADPVAWIERVLTPKPKVIHAKTGLGATLARLRDDIAADERSQEGRGPPPRLLSNG
jgi:uncharacterized protein YdaU (DUF1376 family)